MNSSAISQLAAFGLVADEYERSGDAVKGLRPLFATALSRHAGGAFVPAEFAQSFTETFGIAMAPHVAKSLAPKLTEMHLLAEPKPNSFVISPDLANYAPSREMEGELSSLLSGFSSWASREFSQKGIEFRETELESEFLSRLSRPEFAASFFDEDNETRTARFKAQVFSETALAGRERDGVFDYLVARFITFAHAHAPEVFESLARVSSGALIAEAVAGLASPSTFQLPNGGLRLIVDGPLLLDYLDLNTPEQYAYVRSALEELSDLGFMLATFDHVVDEMRMLINSALREFSAGREYGPLGVRLRSERGFSTYASTVRDSIERRLEDGLGITVLRYELYDQGDREKYFSSAQLDSLRNSLGDLHHQFERRERDAKSIAGTIRLKKENRRPASVFNAGTIFLTRNSRLCKDAIRFLAQGRSEADPRYSVVLDSQLLPIIWFSKGNVDKFAKMSRARLIANCAAAMVPQREVVHKIADFLSEISPKLKDEFSALMSDDRAKLCPMNYTLGISSRIDEQVSMDLVQEMRAALTEPLIEEAREKELRYKSVVVDLEADSHQAKQTAHVLQGAISSFDAKLAQAVLDRDRHAAAKAAADKTIHGIAAEKDAEADDIDRRLTLQANIVRKFIGVGLWLLVAGSALYSIVMQDELGFFALAGTLVGALLFGTGQAWADGLIEWCIRQLHATDRKKAEKLRKDADDLRRTVSTR